LLWGILYFNALWEKFDEIDRDNDHRLQLEEFKRGCELLGMDISAEVRHTIHIYIYIICIYAYTYYYYIFTIRTQHHPGLK
jgi:hypothetical protein